MKTVNSCVRGHRNPSRYADGRCVQCRRLQRLDSGMWLPPKLKTVREQAKESGEKFYDDGKLCRRGHRSVRRTNDGRCVGCEAERAVEYGEVIRQRSHIKYHTDAEYRQTVVSRAATYRARISGSEEYKEKTRDRNKRNREANPAAYNAYSGIRRGKKLNATPSWLSQKQIYEMAHFYDYALLLTEVTSEPHEVDHIVPLQGKTVCGLNVPWNLQVLTAEENRAKGNRLPSEDQLRYVRPIIHRLSTSSSGRSGVS